MMKRDKIIVLLLIIVFIFIVNSQKVEANYTVCTDAPSTGGGDGGGGENGGGDGGPGCSVGETVDCGIADAGAREEISLEEDVYDENNNFIGKAILLTYEQRFMAGRFVGIDAYEKYGMNPPPGQTTMAAPVSVPLAGR